jgi:hypothetical protein
MTRSVKLRSLLLAIATHVGCIHAWEPRDANPIGILVSAGTPSPSFIGFSFTYQWSPYAAVFASSGYLKIDDIETQSFGPSLRVYFLDQALTPMIGGGVNFIRVTGKRSLQGLDESLVAGWLLGGIDYQLWSNFRISGGVNLHFPVRLIFPFVDAAYYF